MVTCHAASSATCSKNIGVFGQRCSMAASRWMGNPRKQRMRWLPLASGSWRHDFQCEGIISVTNRPPKSDSRMILAKDVDR